MLNNNHNDNKGGEDNLYKGLFFGLLLGVGLVWFMGTPTGKDLVKTARKRIDELLSSEPGTEDYDDEATEVPESGSESRPLDLLKPRRFFSKK
jgi:hypothetical protein